MRDNWRFVTSIVVALCALCVCGPALGQEADTPLGMTVKRATETVIYGLYPVSQRSQSLSSAASQVSLAKWQLAKAPEAPGVDVPDADWTEITVPAGIHYALYKAGKIANPWFGHNFNDLQWIQNSDWLLRTTFTVPSEWKGKIVRLRFDGMDYLGSIWLDGKFLGSHAGLFGGPTLDLTDTLTPGSTHTLAIRLLHGLDDAETMKSRVQLGHRVWGNMYKTIGLWQPVRLVATEPAYMEAPYVRTMSIANRTASLFAQTMIVNTGKVFTGTIKARILDLTTGKSVWEQSFRQTVPPGTSFWEQSIKLGNPRLWWPNGMGAQSLYRLELTLNREQTPMDAIKARFGIRTLEIARNPYIPTKPRANGMRTDVWSLGVKPPPEAGNSVPFGRPDLWATDTAVDDDSLHNSDESHRYLFIVNGRPVYGKGVCWMTQDDVLALDPEREKWLMRAAKNADINFFRLNGGNCLFETDRFYDQCDENGILVWQDLMFCWHRETKIPLTVWREQIKQSVLRLRQHPSLAVYVGGNEFSPYALGMINYMGIAREIVASYDDRPWRMNSPSAGSHHSYFAHGLFNEQAFLDLWIGDPNSYIRWFGENVNFVSEWSLMSYANYSQLKRVLPAGELDDQPVGYDAVSFLAKRPVLHDRFTECDRVGKILWNRPSYYGDLAKATIPEMIEYSQMSHAETYGYVFENWRAEFPCKGGETVWTYNSHSPITDWSIIDWFGQPKITYYAVKRAHEPIHVYGKTFLTWGAGDEFSAEVGAINDAAAPLSGVKLIARVLDSSMNEVASKSWTVTVPADGYAMATKKISWQIPAKTPEGFFFLELTLTSADGKHLSRQAYPLKIWGELADPVKRAEWKARPAETKLTKTGPWLKPQMEKCPTTIVAKLLRVSQSGKEAQVRLVVSNTGSKPAYPVRLSLSPDECTVLWTDNYFWLKPGESKEISGVARLDMTGIDNVGTPINAKLSDVTVSVSAWNTPKAVSLGLGKSVKGAK